MRFWILDFGFWIDPTDQSGGLGILDFKFSIGSQDLPAFLYHQGMIGHVQGYLTLLISNLSCRAKFSQINPR
jgi:hypothetical protein